jgi:serine/threonine protein kinase
VPNEDIDEAANAAQQAAIAIAKKEVIGEFIDVNKAPENFDVYEDSYGSDYDFTVGKTKIEVTFKEYNENYYILAFENKTQSRPDTHAATGTERDTVFKKILKCDYNFNDKIWKSISFEGVDFIQKLIVLDPHERMNFDQMTEHPWLSY